MTPDWPLIEREIAGLTVHTTTVLGEGWTSHAYLVNEDLVFRCPKRADDWSELNREVAFLRWAADKLPLPVPEYLHLAPQSHAAPNGYAVYRCIAGRQLDIEPLTSQGRDAAADRIAAFLRQLHLLRPDAPLAEQLPRSDALAEARACFEVVMAAVVPNLEREEAHSLMRNLNSLLTIVQNTEQVIIHADFSREHILAKKGLVAGVIDFGDVSWGDADYDFHYLFLDFGESFTEDVARRYGHTNLDELLTKIRLYALADQLETVLNEEGRALPGQVEAATLRVKELLRL